VQDCLDRGQHFNTDGGTHHEAISIEALLIGSFAIRPSLEALALTSRLLASVSAPLLKLAGVPVVAKIGVHLDMESPGVCARQSDATRSRYQ
jgi:hypothetical protein